MKITKSDLEKIIKEEALRMYQLEKLKKAKNIVDHNINLISEGRKKEMSPEEIAELWGGLKGVFSATKKAAGEQIGKATKAAGEKIGQAKQFVATKYAEGEKKAKIEKLTKEKAKIEAELQKYSQMFTKVNNELKALTKKPSKAKV